MPHVSFTRNLQRHVGCPDRQFEGSTVREALEAVFREAPELRGYILDDQGGLHRHMAVTVNGKATLDRRGLADPVRPEDEVYIMQALSGG